MVITRVYIVFASPIRIEHEISQRFVIDTDSLRPHFWNGQKRVDSAQRQFYISLSERKETLD